MKKLQIRTILSVAMIPLASTSLEAAVIDTLNSGNWQDTGTWTGGVLPGIVDAAHIVSTHTVTVNQAHDIEGLLHDGSVILNSGAILEVSGGTNIGHSFNNSATITLNSGSQLNCSSRLNVGSHVNSGNNVINLNGGAITVTGLSGNVRFEAINTNGGSGTMNLNSGSLTAQGFSAVRRGTSSQTILNWNSASSAGAGVTFNLTASGTYVDTFNSNTNTLFTDFGTGTTFNFNGANFVEGNVITLMTSTSETAYTNYNNINITGFGSTGLGGVLSVSGNNLMLTVVPEPTSAALLGLGGIILLGRRKRS